MRTTLTLDDDLAALLRQQVPHPSDRHFTGLRANLERFLRFEGLRRVDPCR